MAKVALDANASPGILYWQGYRIPNIRDFPDGAALDENYPMWVEVSDDDKSALENVGYTFVTAGPPPN